MSTINPLLTVENRDILTVKPYWRNPRKNDNAVDAVAHSIQTYGFNSPITVDKKGTIVTGHTRYRAAMKLGMTTIPCVVLTLPPDKIKAFRIADNKSSELATWDTDKLIIELREIGNLDDMSFFFPDIDLPGMIAENVGAVDYKDTVQSDVDKKSKELSEKYNKDSHEGSESEPYVDVSCPECGHEFSVRRADL